MTVYIVQNKIYDTIIAPCRRPWTLKGTLTLWNLFVIMAYLPQASDRVILYMNFYYVFNTVRQVSVGAIPPTVEFVLICESLPVNLYKTILAYATYTVDSRYLEVQGTLWNTWRYPDLDKSDLQNWGKKLIEQPHFTNEYVSWLLKLEAYWKYCRKEKLLLRSNFFSFP